MFCRGDLVKYYGGVYEVFSVSNGSQVLGIRRSGPRGNVAYVWARKCRKVGSCA